MLSDAQIERYSRQIVLPEVGGRGQERLLASSVAVCGADDSARWAALYLAAAGVGRVTVAGTRAETIAEANPDSRVVSAAVPADAAAAAALLDSQDAVIVAGADDAVCERVAAACAAATVTLFWGNVESGRGRVAVLARPDGGNDAPCLDCVRPAPGGAAEIDHALAVVTARLVGALLAVQVVEALLRPPSSRKSRLLSYDPVAGILQDEPLVRDPACRRCSSTNPGKQHP